MLHIAKSLLNLKLINPHFRYATETKNIFSLPKRQFIHPTALNEVTSVIGESYTVKMLAYAFRVINFIFRTISSTLQTCTYRQFTSTFFITSFNLMIHYSQL